MSKKERIEQLETDVAMLESSLARMQKRFSYVTGSCCLDVKWGQVEMDFLHTSRTLEGVLENTEKAVRGLDKCTKHHQSLIDENVQLHEMLESLCDHLGVEIVRTAPEPSRFVVEEKG